MITKEKLLIYKKYGGDADMWARHSGHYLQYNFDNNDWNTIDSLIQDITIIENGLASQEYITLVEQKLVDNCDSNEAISLLKSLATRMR